MSSQTHWHLSAEQVAQFSQLGYLVLPDQLPDELFSPIKTTADKVIEHAFKLNTASPDFAFTHRYLQPFLNRISNFHLYGGFDSLAILGCPQIVSIAQSLCGENCLPTVDMMILKNKGDDLDLPWHQDLIYQTGKYQVIAVGIYLEDAMAGDGALKLVKNTQHQKQDIDAVKANPPDEIIEVPAKAGDIVVHDPMLVHWSDGLLSQKQRRTLYYEFRPVAQVVDEAHWPEAIINNRLDLLATAIEVYNQAYPNQNQSYKKIGTPVTDLTAVYQPPVPFEAANFAKKHRDK